MTVRIDYERILENIYALAALKAVTGSAELPGPVGRHEAEALRALCAACLRDLGRELGATATDVADGRLELPPRSGITAADVEAAVEYRLTALLAPGSGSEAAVARHMAELQARRRGRPGSIEPCIL